LRRRGGRSHTKSVPKKGTDRLRTVIAQVLDYAAPSLRELAHDVGVTYRAMQSYQKQQRTPPAAVLRRLVSVLRARGGKLQRLADQLERQAGGR
jgi:hypothetical protein